MDELRVLIVEDDRALGLFLKKGLEMEGHRVEWVGDGEAALVSVAQDRPDLLVLDLSLPVCDGLEVLQVVRAQMPEVAVLVLTGRSQVQERVRCLNLGADDYLQKPFSFHELTARCRAILRRAERSPSAVVQFGGIVMNRAERAVTCHGRPVQLTGREFLLLEALLRRRGECCSRAELLLEVWQGRPEVAANVVDVYVNYLRRKLDEAAPGGGEGGRDSAIQTVRGSGYRLRGETEAAHKPAMSARKAVMPERLPPRLLAQGA
jgi:DNA-binding response OmpR family regulator